MSDDEDDSEPLRPSRQRHEKASTPLYICDLPCNFDESTLGQKLRERLERTQHVTIVKMKCYPSLGIASVQLSKEAQRVQLVSDVQSMVLDPKKGTLVAFVDQVELDSYVVLDRDALEFPSAEEVANSYMDNYYTVEPPLCEMVSTQFPNIFRLVPQSFDDLVATVDQSGFVVGNQSATVYPLADCSFFQDLPANTTDAELSNSINTPNDLDGTPSTFIYAQINEGTRDSLVLTARSAKVWEERSYLTIEGENIQRKRKLSYRVVVSPVPETFNIDLILNHNLFKGFVAEYSHINDDLAIEFDDMDRYDHCLSNGSFRVGGQALEITRYKSSTTSTLDEINAETWYETEMLKIKPNIMPIVAVPEHPIFHSQWNAQQWLKQFEKSQSSDAHSSDTSLRLHLLRITVMLNTIGVVRKQEYLLNGKHVSLASERMKTIVYDHKSRLSGERRVPLAKMKTPFPSTSVHVVNDDCLVIYEKLVSEERKPLLLNMASATSPGGGYRKGDGAQEENIFRRSDYYQSLDVQVADEDRSERLYCTSNSDEKRVQGEPRFYPMEEFGAIYTSGITAFRGIEADGYEYMKKPLHNVCALAMAAHRNPTLENNHRLAKKFAVSLRKKIENIFAIAYHKKHDSLILSALGCGAFNNPPEHVAQLFKSIIIQYAGFFHSIYFAILDDHNTGNKTNPKGNFLPFDEALSGFIVHPPTNFRVGTSSGPTRILNETTDGYLMLSDVHILDRPLCDHGGQCRDLKDPRHSSEYSHPPLCPRQSQTSSCDLVDDEVHRLTFTHNISCKFGGTCRSTDPEHLKDYGHPEFCKDKVSCNDINPQHMLAFRHQPECPDALDCFQYLKSDPEHCESFRHCKSICPFDNCCPNFHDKRHTKKTLHSFRPPCPLTPYSCAMHVRYMQADKLSTIPQEVDAHCLIYSHVCLFGRLCTKRDADHLTRCLHIARQLCPDLDQCSRLTEEDHLASFSHPGIRDIRLLCNRPGYECRDRLAGQHLKKYRHDRTHDHPDVALSFDLNVSVNFVRNQSEMIDNVNSYVEASNWNKTKISSDVLNWIRALQPVHRCGQLIFESILVHGHVMSRDYMKLLEKPKYVARAVQQHSRVRLIFLKHDNKSLKEKLAKLILAIVEAEFEKANGAKTSTTNSTAAGQESEHEYQMSMLEKKIKPTIDDSDIGKIREWATTIAQASIKLNQTPMGIGYDVDRLLGTDKHVFSILGPHLGHYYGDIIILFKPEIMLHPDANFSIQAGTSFHSARAYNYRPWLKDPGDEPTRANHFHSSKLHCSVPRYEFAAATELVALTGLSGKSMNVSVPEILKRWMNVDSHQVFESHLPQLIPLNYIERVYIPENVFESLSPEAQRSAKGAFKDGLIITKHKLDLSLIVPGKTVPLDPTREAYQTDVLAEICKAIEHRMAKPGSSRGTVVTAAASGFEQQIVVPITISQAYSLHCVNRSQQAPHPENTYIYWQAMNGDMMLTLSNERMERTGKDQPELQCLICYVAEKPSKVNPDDYHEGYSYLNDGDPCHHDNSVSTGQFKAKSNRFYLGCNIEDFLTFCLHIDHKTGQVVLSHAGSNGLYNQERIEHRFDRSNLDLAKLDYIHVSAGSQDVPIRNLTIHFEPVRELHLSVDRDFQLDTSALLQKHYSPTTQSLPAVVTARPTHSLPSSRTAPVSSARPPPAPKETSFFGRLMATLGCQQAEVNHSIHYTAPSPVVSKLPACADSVYCLLQYSAEHIAEYSHLCRFSELCRNKASEPHLVHVRHDVPVCADDPDCSQTDDPVHRASFRHSKLPDYLIPCRQQVNCRDKSPEHRIKYFHGETLPSIERNKKSTTIQTSSQRYPCKFGNECRSIRDPGHLAKYSHSTS